MICVNRGLFVASGCQIAVYLSHLSILTINIKMLLWMCKALDQSPA